MGRTFSALWHFERLISSHLCTLWFRCLSYMRGRCKEQKKMTCCLGYVACILAGRRVFLAMVDPLCTFLQLTRLPGTPGSIQVL